MTDEARKKRLALIGIVAGVLLIGVVGGTVALLSGDESTDGDVVIAPGAGLDPRSIEGICRSEGVSRFEVAPDPKAQPELTATGAVEPYVGKSELSVTTSVGEDEKLVAIGDRGALPRVVLTVKRADGVWSIAQTSACLVEPGDGDEQCSQDLEVAGTAYTREVAPENVTADTLLGNGRLTSRAPDDSLKACKATDPLLPRGDIGPVSAYQAKGETGVVVVSDGDFRYFAR